MGDLELLPGHHSSCSNFVRLHSEATVFIVEQMRFLGKDSRQKSYDCPREKTSVGGSVASVKEGVVLLGVTM